MKRKVFTLFAVLLVIVLFISCGKKQERVIVMGLVPHRDAEKLIEEIKPLEERLSKEMGVTVKGFTATNYVAVVEGFGSKKVDFGLIPPFASLLAMEEFNAKPLLVVKNKKGETTYKSQILVRKDANIKSFADIKGHKVAFVEPSSTSGYLFPASMMKENGIDLDKDVEFLYSGGHDKSVQLLVNGDVDVAPTYVDIRERLTKEFPTAMDQTEVLAYTDPIPGVGITVSANMSDEEALKLKQAFLNIANTEDGKKLLIDLFQIYGFEDVDVSSYDIIKRTAKNMDMDLKKQ